MIKLIVNTVEDDGSVEVSFDSLCRMLGSLDEIMFKREIEFIKTILINSITENPIEIITKNIKKVQKEYD